jgi:adenosylcobyric acid synthase
LNRLYVVGIGPGGLGHMTQEARETIGSAEVVVGYRTYLDFIAPLLAGKEVVSSGMMKEEERCRQALNIAASGRDVALVSGGDAGIYGMAGLALELAPLQPEEVRPEIVIVPGVSALQAAASVLGAPLMHDFAVISLSDLLTPWGLIEQRLQAAAAADFVTAIYNPRSRGRVVQLERARELFLSLRSPHTPVGIVRNACREGEEKVVTTLDDMLSHRVDMFSLVLIGNSATFVDEGGRMVTPRGYRILDRDPGAENREEPGRGSRVPGPESRPLMSRVPGPESRSLMFCGTGSDVGKSVLAAGFCRILRDRGIAVAPFKSQNMALNSAVTPEGGEIGRAQAVQAEACGIEPHTDMNPVLLKPNSETGSQVIVQGRPVGSMSVREYMLFKPRAFEKIGESFRRLSSRYSFIVIEGAGSIAEINLKSHDIANLKIAEMAGAPVILVADIDRGGVFAQIVGTLELMDRNERSMIKGVVINKFRGDPSLLASGIRFVEERTGVPVLGVIPWFDFRVPEEDSVALQRRGTRETGSGTGAGNIRIGVVRLPRISNYTDFAALESEPDVTLSYLERREDLDGLDVVILPGSKATIPDLAFLHRQGLAEAIRSFPGEVVGICGGYQMLGKLVSDPEGVESSAPSAGGLGLLDVETILRTEKETHLAEGVLFPAGTGVAPDCAATLRGYEIHMGETAVGPGSEPFCSLKRRSGIAVTDGAVSPDGRIFGTYLHGLFDNDGFRRSWLNRLRRRKGLPPAAENGPGEDPLDLLAVHLERHLDVDRVLSLCGLSGSSAVAGETFKRIAPDERR